MIYVKSSCEVEKMRRAGKIVAGTFDAMKPYIKPGVTTKELDQIAKDYILSQGAKPSFLNYGGFPKNICTSVNEVVIHGIPGLEKLEDGDIISIDVGAVIDGFHGDAARTFPVGNISSEAQRLVSETEKSFFEGLKYAKHGERVYSISATIQNYIEDKGFGIVRHYCGHGIGKNLHEDPEVPNYGTFGKGPRLCKGMTLAIEPMVTYGDYKTKCLADGWTVVTLDKSLAAHYENTILITDGDPELLTY